MSNKANVRVGKAISIMEDTECTCRSAQGLLAASHWRSLLGLPRQGLLRSWQPAVMPPSETLVSKSMLAWCSPCFFNLETQNASEQGVWADGRRCFSVGLDQRLRSWRFAAPQPHRSGAQERGDTGSADPGTAVSAGQRDRDCAAVSGPAAPEAVPGALVAARTALTSKECGTAARAVAACLPQVAGLPLLQEGRSAAAQPAAASVPKATETLLAGQGSSTAEQTAACVAEVSGMPLFEEEGSMAVQVLEPGALTALRSASEVYTVVVAGRGTQVLRASPRRRARHRVSSLLPNMGSRVPFGMFKAGMQH